MSAVLNNGTGRCLGTARLLIKPIQAVIELGASRDVLTKTLGAVHHANRHGSTEDFIAVALPLMRMGRNCMLPGHEIELIGSEASLSGLLSLDGVRSLSRRGMLMDLEIGETFVDEGMSGVAYVRDHACEKHTPGWIRRSMARAERRGKPVGKAVKARGNDLSALALPYGRTILHVRAVTGEIGSDPMMVSTYGFSSIKFPAILPVVPGSAQEIDDAA